MAIISYQHNFIFVKTTKTAGTSIEIDLSAVAGGDAIVTPIVPTVSGHAPRHFQDDTGKAAFFNHMPASRIQALIGDRQFAAMHSFCVEREPVAKCISHFHMLRNSPQHNSAGQYKNNWSDYCAEGRFPVDIEKYSEVREGRRMLLVDTILAYESLPQSLPALLRSFGIADFNLKAQAKSEYSRKKLVDITEVTPAQRQRIYAAFAKTCALTGMYSGPL